MRIGIFGTGRFGAFWATELSRVAEVVVYNRSERPVPEGTHLVDLADLGASDAVMLCVAISSVEPAVAALSPHLQPDCVLMDTCSVKLFPTRVMLEKAPSETVIVGTHPMFGPDSASEGLAGLPLVFCPVRCSETTANAWRAFFGAMGLRVLNMTPEEHDREAAFTQGITHFLGRVLADMGIRPSEMATVGYRKVLEVMEQTCNDPYTLFQDLQRLNPHTAEMRVQLRDSFERVMRALESRLDT